MQATIDEQLVEELAVEGMTPETIVEKLGWERKTLPMVRQIVRDMAEHELNRREA